MSSVVYRSDKYKLRALKNYEILRSAQNDMPSPVPLPLGEGLG